MSLLKERVELSIQEAELSAQQNLSNLPTIVRWFVILGVLAIIPAYFISKNISYKLWSAKYSATLIQAKPAFTNPKDLNISDVYVTTNGEGVYAGVVKVTNENLDLSAKNIPYIISFLNAKEETIYSEQGKFYVLPNQTKHIIAPRFTSTEQIVYTNFSIDKDSIKWQKRINLPIVTISNSTPKTYQQFSPLSFVVEGDITNQSPYNIKQVRITFVLYDKNQNIIGASQRDEFSLKPFERRTYKQLWPNISESNIYTVKVFTDTNTLDPNNITVETSEINSSSNLSRPQNKNPF